MESHTADLPGYSQLAEAIGRLLKSFRRRRALEKISPDNNKSGIENAKYFATRKTAVRSVPFDSMKRAYDIDKRCKLILESRIRVLKFESRSRSG